MLNFNHRYLEMYLDQAKKAEIFGQYSKQGKATDTGSAESQIALFTYRIKHLTEHLKEHRKDYCTARSLTQLVGKRRALLDYLYDRDVERYRDIIKALGLRK
jgi:small subunit ribosomal protein S15